MRSAAQDYLEQINPDRPFRNRIYKRYSNTRIEDDDEHYHIQLKRPDEVPEDPLSRFYYRLGKGTQAFVYLLFGSILVAGVYFGLKDIIIGESVFLPIFIVGIIFLLFVGLAVRDGTRPAKKNQGDEDENDKG
jgi:hypothetical protein